MKTYTATILLYSDPDKPVSWEIVNAKETETFRFIKECVDASAPIVGKTIEEELFDAILWLKTAIRRDKRKISQYNKTEKEYSFTTSDRSEITVTVHP